MKILWSALSLLFLGVCTAATPVPLPPTRQEGKSVWLVAHRGGAALAPENTLASFKNGLALGADFLEMDVHLSRDGVPVVIHDPTITRTTDGEGRVSDLSVAEMQSYNAAAKFPGGAYERQVIPTFAQVLDLGAGNAVRFEVEVKADANGKLYPGIEQKVVDEIAARGLVDRVRILAFEFDTLKEIKRIEPRLQAIALLSVEYFRVRDIRQPAAVIEDVMKYGADGIGVNKDLLTRELVAAAHERGKIVGVWTVDAEPEMRKFIEMGVDSITSNRPDALKRVLRGGQ